MDRCLIKEEYAGGYSIEAEAYTVPKSSNKRGKFRCWRQALIKDASGDSFDNCSNLGSKTFYVGYSEAEAFPCAQSLASSGVSAQKIASQFLTQGDHMTFILCRCWICETSNAKEDNLSENYPLYQTIELYRNLGGNEWKILVWREVDVNLFEIDGNEEIKRINTVRVLDRELSDNLTRKSILLKTEGEVENLLVLAR